MSLKGHQQSKDLGECKSQQKQIPRGRSGPGLREIEGGRERIVGDEARAKGVISHGVSEAIVKPLAFLLG